MTIDEAIERLTRQIGITSPTLEPFLIETYKLSIEALKLVIDFRTSNYWGRPKLLPGETEK